MIRHPLAVEEGHLFLYGTEDAGVTRMQADDEVAKVVVLLHQLTLFFEIHVGTAAYDCAWLVALRQSLGY